MLRERYFWAAVVLVTFIAFRSTAGNWTGDFWSHSAAVRELSERPLQPRHPEIAADLPGPFNSPYTVAVAWLARVTQMTPVKALAIAGVFNLVLLLVSLWLYVRELFERADLTAFYALVFMLFLWGSSPWVWSAFFHFEALPYVVGYPSTFATALLFGLLALYVRWLKRTRPAPVSVVIGGGALVVLTHPVTFGAFAIAIAAHTIGVPSARSWRQKLGATAGMGVAAAVLAATWPFYPFLRALGERATYHASNSEMYVDVCQKIWPIVILGVPCVLWRLMADRRDPIALTLLGLTAAYGLGGLTERFGYGRMISHAAIMLQLCVAAAATKLEMNLAAGQARLRMHAAAVSIIAVFAVAVGVNATRIKDRLLDRSDWTSMYTFLQRYVGHDEVVLSDLVSSYPVPTFAGKVVAHVGALPLVPDADSRARDVELFFNPDTTTDARLDVVKKYRVRWVLLNREHAEIELIQHSLEAVGLVRHVDDRWVLIQIVE